MKINKNIFVVHHVFGYLGAYEKIKPSGEFLKETTIVAEEIRASLGASVNEEIGIYYAGYSRDSQKTAEVIATVLGSVAEQDITGFLIGDLYIEEAIKQIAQMSQPTIIVVSSGSFCEEFIRSWSSKYLELPDSWYTVSHGEWAVLRSSGVINHSHECRSKE